MTAERLDGYLAEEIKAFPCKTSLLVAGLESGAVRHAFDPEVQVVSASTIKVPILLAALEEVRRGRLSLEQSVPLPADGILEDTEVFDRGEPAYSLWELLYWMTVVSDNTATNRVLDLIGFETVNEYAVSALGLKHTLCQRKMLDWPAIKAGRNNYTSAADQCRIYRLLCRGQLLTPALTETALDMLRRQRCMDSILRYIPDRVDFAHKTGGLDYLSHDAGVFFQEKGDYFVGIFTWDGPSAEGDPRQKRYIGRLAKAIFETYR